MKLNIENIVWVLQSYGANPLKIYKNGNISQKYIVISFNSNSNLWINYLVKYFPNLRYNLSPGLLSINVYDKYRKHKNKDLEKYWDSLIKDKPISTNSFKFKKIRWDAACREVESLGYSNIKNEYDYVYKIYQKDSKIIKVVKVKSNLNLKHIAYEDGVSRRVKIYKPNKKAGSIKEFLNERI